MKIAGREQSMGGGCGAGNSGANGREGGPGIRGYGTGNPELETGLCRRGQATIEFMLVFALSLAAVSLIAASLRSMDDGLKGKADDLEQISRAEAAARALEAMHNAGGRMAFDFREEGVSYSVERGRFHSSHERKVIEIGGVFENDGSEPV